MPLARRDEWPERLGAVFAAAMDRPFDYGEHDCCLFAADAIEALTGLDVAADWRGRYSTPAEGLALAGVKTLAALPGKIGLKSVHPALAHRGDIALANVGARADVSSGQRVGQPAPMLLVFDGAILRAPAGMAAPRAHAVRAWRVG